MGFLQSYESFLFTGGLTMMELNIACKKLDLLIKAGVDIDRSKAIAKEWERMGKVSYSSRIKRQKINSLKKAK
jgi:hypothetical protein